jgi:hypothetical protein
MREPDKPTVAIQLRRQGDQVVLDPGDGKEPKPVKLVWAQPVSRRGGPVSILDAEKNEIAMLPNLDALDPESRQVAEDELLGRYLVARITRVIRARATYGVRYWHVETDRGERRFAIKHTSKNAIWVTDNHLVLRDTLGCRYEINPFSALDRRSRAEVEKVL